MALKMILNKQTDFTKEEFPAEYAASGLWRFNESAPDEDKCSLPIPPVMAETAICELGGNNRQSFQQSQGQTDSF